MLSDHIDLKTEIYREYLCWDSKRGMSMSNKYFNNIYTNAIKNADKIRDFYLQRKLVHEVNVCATKNMIIRYYIAKYPIEYLFRYPEFMANKLHRDDLLSWIAANLNTKHTKRTMRNIRDFFSLDISINEIFYAGW